MIATKRLIDELCGKYDGTLEEAQALLDKFHSLSLPIGAYRARLEERVQGEARILSDGVLAEGDILAPEGAKADGKVYVSHDIGWLG